MPGFQAIIFVHCSKTPKLSLPLLGKGENHAAPSPDWENGKHQDLEWFLHTHLSVEGATVWVPHTLVTTAVHRKKGCGSQHCDTVWFLHCVHSGSSEAARSALRHKLHACRELCWRTSHPCCKRCSRKHHSEQLQS